MSNKLERYDEISMKLLRVGEALIMEGEDKEDFTILSVGNFIIFISSIIYDENDVHLFSELCSMMAAKKMMGDSELMDLLSTLDFKELQALVKNIKDNRK
jgi:hypothetical protein